MATPNTVLTDAIRRKRGEVRPITIKFELNGEPKPITGWTFTVSVARSPNSVSLYKGVSTVEDGSSGIASLVIPTAVTDLPSGTYYVEIRFLTPGGIDQVAASIPLLLEPALSLT